MLRLFYVDTWCRWGRSLLARGPRPCRALATHFSPGLPQELVVSFNRSVLHSRALFHLRRCRLSTRDLSHEYCRFGEKFAGLVREHLKRQELDWVSDSFFGFNSNCLETLEYLRARGVFTVVDQVDPGKVEEDLCIEEAERWPEWSRVPGRMSADYWDRIKAEWTTADLVLVNSEWSAEALVQQGVARDKLIVVPLALDLPGEKERPGSKPEGKLKVLWLGSIILRKGIQYLVQAARLLEREGVEFILAGSIGVSDRAVRSFPPNMRLIGNLTRNHVGDVYQQAHVFVLPTLSDGFAITQLEAMAHSLPVVTTPNCGKVVTDGVDGFIVPVRQPQALAEAIYRLHANRSLLAQMSANALRTVKKYDLSSNAAMIQRLVTERRHSNKPQGREQY